LGINHTVTTTSFYENESCLPKLTIQKAI
jgi:hypothetical protein